MSAIEQHVIDGLRELEHDWNGYGEKPIDQRAIDTLAWISFVPLANGGVQMEWHTAQFDIEVEVAADGSLRSVMSERTA